MYITPQMRLCCALWYIILRCVGLVGGWFANYPIRKQSMNGCNSGGVVYVLQAQINP
jgi:hypothetical protein